MFGSKARKPLQIVRLGVFARGVHRLGALGQKPQTHFTFPHREQVSSPEDVAAVLQHYFEDKDREEFIVVFLDTANTMIGMSQVSVVLGRGFRRLHLGFLAHPPEMVHFRSWAC